MCSENPVLALLRTENLKLLLFTKLSCRFYTPTRDVFYYYSDISISIQNIYSSPVNWISPHLTLCIQYTFISLSALSFQKVPEPSSGFRDPISSAQLRKYFRFRPSSMLLRSYLFFYLTFTTTLSRMPLTPNTYTVVLPAFLALITPVL